MAAEIIIIMQSGYIFLEYYKYKKRFRYIGRTPARKYCNACKAAIGRTDYEIYNEIYKPNKEVSYD